MEKKRRPQHLDSQALEKTLNHLSLLFDRVTGSYRTARPVKDTDLYKTQVEFCYLINEIQQGYLCFQHKNISKCYDFINNLNSDSKKIKK